MRIAIYIHIHAVEAQLKSHSQTCIEEHHLIFLTRPGFHVTNIDN